MPFEEPTEPLDPYQPPATIVYYPPDPYPAQSGVFKLYMKNDTPFIQAVQFVASGSHTTHSLATKLITDSLSPFSGSISGSVTLIPVPYNDSLGETTVKYLLLKDSFSGGYEKINEGDWLCWGAGPIFFKLTLSEFQSLYTLYQNP